MKEIVGETVAVSGYQPRPYECWVFLNRESAEKSELMQTGLVYEILEERKDDRCYGIVETSTMETEQRPLDVLLSTRRGLSTKAIKLRIVRTSGLDAPVSDRCKVALANPEGVAVAYNMGKEGIPVGIFTLPTGQLTQPCVVRIPRNYLVGGEAAHADIGGQSGYCKTALALIVSKSILSDPILSGDTCIIAFNVKRDDLLWIDYPNPEITREDEKLYEMMGIECKPFDNVHIYAPESASGGVASLRKNAKPFTWEWMDIKDRLQFGVAEMDWDERLETILTDLASQEDLKEFREVISALEDWGKEADSVGRGWGHGHHTATIKKTIRIIKRGMMEGFKGLLCGQESEELPITKLLEPSFFNVIDLNLLEVRAQRLVIGKVVADVQDRLATGEADVDRVVYVTDELSRFAPKEARQGPIAGIKTVFEEIAERGRSMGSVIMGIEQYPSKISDSITGNVATTIYAKMKWTEMDASIYRGYPKAVKELIRNLRKGFAVVDHDTFNDLILIKFPRPPCAQGRPVNLVSEI